MISTIQTSNINNYKYQVNSKNIVFGHNHSTEKNPLSRKQKLAILGSSAAGMIPVMAFWAKRKGFSLNPAKILNTPLKDWAIFKYAPKDKSIQFKAPQILSVATGSVAGGFIGGAIVDDKSNLKAKKREILSQLLGNVTVPVACVASGAALYEKYADKIEGAMPQIKGNSGFIKGFNKFLTKLPNAATTLTLLGIGIYFGNKVSNLINEKLYHKKVERNIKASDFAPHVDDLCMATSMMNEGSSFGSKLGRIIPIALLVPGYQTGIAQSEER
ncbi:hypothetical protein HDR58_02440 [bacterium]|nr:hypothetical protein [bacterium]